MKDVEKENSLSSLHAISFVLRVEEAITKSFDQQRNSLYHEGQAPS